MSTRKPKAAPPAEVPGLAYYTAPQAAAPRASRRMTALDLMFGYYTGE
ncbi:MAG: hypothetical protein IH625_07050 [Rhodobacteraceae bacterium]|nr:hypothetical protein [Paracoccaceae bacterium]